MELERAQTYRKIITMLVVAMLASCASPPDVNSQAYQYYQSETAIAKNLENPFATPLPESLQRKGVSHCLESKEIEACTKPISLDEGKERVEQLYLYLELASSHLSPQTNQEIDNLIQTMLEGITNYQKEVPHSPAIRFYESLFPEATGGAVITYLSTRTGIPTFDLHLQTPLYVNDVFTEMEMATISLHEVGHAAEGIERFQKFGDVATSNEEGEQEERTLAFLELSFESALLDSAGVLDQPEYQARVKPYLNMYGLSIGRAAYWLDKRAVGADSQIWTQIYDLLFTRYWMAKTNSLNSKTPSDSDMINVREVEAQWSTIALTPEEKALLDQLVQDGINEGWIMPGAIPLLP